MKVVINKCYGGFGLSDLAKKKYMEYSNDLRPPAHVCSFDIGRDDPILVRVVEELGVAANDHFAELQIVEIPDGTGYYIGDYKGMESIHEYHNTWD